MAGKVYCLYAGEDGRSRFTDAPLQLQDDGAQRWSTGFLGAKAWMYSVAQREREVDWHTAGPGGVSVMIAGCMEVEAGNGDRRTVEAGDVLFALDTTGQGHRTYLSAGACGLTVAFEGDPRVLLQSLFAVPPPQNGQ